MEWAIVLGCYVSPEGVPCAMLEDRVRTAVGLVRRGMARRILMSGDRHEVPVMGALACGEVRLDPEGFSTGETMERAFRVFGIREAVVVTQGFHLARSVYLARRMGIEAYGCAADLRPYRESYAQREFLARVKDYFKYAIRR